MRETFICEDCGAAVFDTVYREAGGRTRCFICDWVRGEEPDDAEKRARLRAELCRE